MQGGRGSEARSSRPSDWATNAGEGVISPGAGPGPLDFAGS